MNEKEMCERDRMMEIGLLDVNITLTDKTQKSRASAVLPHFCHLAYTALRNIINIHCIALATIA